MKKYFMVIVLCVITVFFVGCNKSEKEASEAVDKAIVFHNKRMNNSIKSVDEEIKEVKDYDIDKDVEEARENLEFRKSSLTDDGYKKEKSKVDGIKEEYQNEKFPEELKRLENSKRNHEESKFDREKSYIIVYEDDNNYYVLIRKNKDKEVVVKGFKVGKENGRVTQKDKDWKKIEEYYEDNTEPIYEEKNVDLSSDTIELTHI
ncbi:hypothetical protein WN865_01160 [Tetragenococcus halophilus]